MLHMGHQWGVCFPPGAGAGPGGVVVLVGGAGPDGVFVVIGGGGPGVFVVISGSRRWVTCESGPVGAALESSDGHGLLCEPGERCFKVVHPARGMLRGAILGTHGELAASGAMLQLSARQIKGRECSDSEQTFPGDQLSGDRGYSWRGAGSCSRARACVHSSGPYHPIGAVDWAV